jgi:hypothetical protein
MPSPAILGILSNVQKKRGLTLSEVVMALGVMTALSLVIVAVFTKLLISSTKNTDLTTANLLARSILDQTVRKGPGQNPNEPDFHKFTTPGEKVSLSTNNKNSKTKFVYEVRSQRITNEADSTLGNLYNVEVIVSWWSDEADESNSRADYGKLSTQISRTVYVKE